MVLWNLIHSLVFSYFSKLISLFIYFCQSINLSADSFIYLNQFCQFDCIQVCQMRLCLFVVLLRVLACTSWQFSFSVWWKWAAGRVHVAAKPGKRGAKPWGMACLDDPHFLFGRPHYVFLTNRRQVLLIVIRKLSAIKTKLYDVVFAQLRRRAKSVKGGSWEKCER